jgi:hypothetical protein
MWRHIGNSVVGAAHADEGGECQDHCLVRELTSGDESVLVACVADGAGSSKFGAEGSGMACEAIVECAAAYLESHGSFDALEAGDVIRWCNSIRERIEVAATARDSTPRDFATTACVSILSPTRAVFFQVGDGAMIVRRNGVCGVVFWPQSGEYANMTNFLTDETFADRLEFVSLPVQIDNVALFTDGIERLALTFESQTPHPPFFEPLFDALRSVVETDGLSQDMRQFLQSQSVRERSDDDKTLVLACWVDGEPSQTD